MLLFGRREHAGETQLCNRVRHRHGPCCQLSSRHTRPATEISITGLERIRDRRNDSRPAPGSREESHGQCGIGLHGGRSSQVPLGNDCNGRALLDAACQAGLWRLFSAISGLRRSALQRRWRLARRGRSCAPVGSGRFDQEPHVTNMTLTARQIWHVLQELGKPEKRAICSVRHRRHLVVVSLQECPHEP